MKTKEGRATELLRTFDDLSLRSELGDESNDSSAIDAFEGHTVRFVWDAEKSAYEKSFVGKGGDIDALLGLAADMDVTCLLPGKKTGEGDTWDVRGAALGALFFPGGRLPMTDEDKGSVGDRALRALIVEIEKELESFKVTCTNKGAHEVGKARVGEIAFTFEGKLEPALAEIIASGIQLNEGETPEMDIQTVLTLTGEGRLEWDLERGQLHALEMHADLGLVADIAAQFEEQGQSLEVKAHVTASGKATWELALK